MRICLLMFYDDNIKEYGDITYQINKKYCEKYNIDIIVSNKITYKDRKTYWERIPLLLENIEKYDYLMWIDADAFFYYDANNIIDIIKLYNNVNFIFSKDIDHSGINSGFFIVKSSKYSIEFLQKWAYDEELYKKNMCPIDWEDQGLLIHMLLTNELNITQHYICIEYGVLQHFYEDELSTLIVKPYIFHLAGRRDNKFRVEFCKEYFDKMQNIIL